MYKQIVGLTQPDIIKDFTNITGQKHMECEDGIWQQKQKNVTHGKKPKWLDEHGGKYPNNYNWRPENQMHENKY